MQEEGSAEIQKGAGAQGAGAQGAGAQGIALYALGIALALSAGWCEQLAQVALTTASNSVILYLSGAVSLCVFFGCAIFHRRLKTIRIMPAVFIVAGAMAMAGRALRISSGLFWNTPIPVYIGVVLYSAGEAFLLLFWIVETSHLEPRQTRAVFPLAYLSVALIFFILSSAPGWFATDALCLFPLLSGLLFSRLLRRVFAPLSAGDDTPDPDEQVSWSFPYYPVVLLVIYKFVFYASLPFTNGPSSFGPFGIMAICGVALIGTVFFFDRYTPNLLYRLALPLLCAGLLMVGWLNTGAGVATLLSNAGNIGFELFMLIALSEACFRYSIDALWMFGILEGFSTLASTAAWGAGNYLASRFPAGTPEASTLIACTVIVLIAISMLFFNDRMASSTFGAEPIARMAGDNGEATPTVMSYYEDLVWRCSLVGRRYGLTHREEEVLELLAQGMGLPRIEEDLCISNSTAKTHVHHIYEKLDVHTRDEARKIVDEAGKR